ncbi:MAG: bifunctional [glutamine synthetase] adenylyltransferase/[glutamine synthetase]-adenylyl-L-tyrosine phosphorylase [Alphaproteobacteria bacterium]|nr:bifunctional [glutamine synthetase] adenylyltransferase/[glutamine synthetase]-adenylyl-L-tyrosine phosphorylase [Alphaproteobacteria bacterium]
MQNDSTIQLNSPNKKLIASLQGDKYKNLEANLQAIFGGSAFLRSLYDKYPEWLSQWQNQGQNQGQNQKQDFDNFLQQIKSLSKQNDEARFMAQARLLKTQIAFNIALNDLNGISDFTTTTQQITVMAEQLIQQCFQFTLKKMKDSLNLTHNNHSETNCGFTIIALGKLGAGELNYSSDVDLLLLYDDKKFIPRNQARAEQTIQQFVRYFIELIEKRTHEGYLFRTDLRLRPNPSSTPPAMKISTALIYYESIARNWERMVMIRANPIAGDIALGQEFLQQISPFLWRRSIDYSTLEDIHHLQQQMLKKSHIDANENGSNSANIWAGYNVKTGKGGIRSCEFYVQMLQLLWGGKYPDLRHRGMFAAIDGLHQQNYIDSATKQHLLFAYPYLRMIEHRLQMQNDLQIQTLPKNQSDMEIIAQFSGYDNSNDFLSHLANITEKCQKNYDDLLQDFIAPTAPAHQAHINNTIANAQKSDKTKDNIHHLIHQLPFTQKENIIDGITLWQNGELRATSSERARHLLATLLPDILEHLAQTLNPDQAFISFDKFLNALPAGVQLFALFKAHPPLLRIIATIMGNAPQLANMLSLNPELLEIFLEDEEIPTDKQSAIRAMQNRLPPNAEYEDILSHVRIFTREMQFIIGCQILDGTVPITQNAQYLCALAEAGIQMIADATQAEFIKQYGNCGEFAVIAMGKFGSQLLLPHSDLDLVFLYRTTQETSDGEKKLFASTYYQKFAQRLTSALTVATHSGELYQVDLRLRPWGNDGAIANQLATYKNYYRDDAFAFEKIALSRARPIYGSDDFRQQIEQVMHEILAIKPENVTDFIHDIADMRVKISATHPTTGLFNIKHKRGGLVEVEFIVQVLYLDALTKNNPAKDNMPYLNDYHAIIGYLVKQQYLQPDEGACLIDALEFYISLQAGLRLTNLNHKQLDLLMNDETQQQSQQKSLLSRADILAKIAHVEDFTACIDKCNDLQQRVTKIYHHYIGQYHKNATNIIL